MNRQEAIARSKITRPRAYIINRMLDVAYDDDQLAAYAKDLQCVVAYQQERHLCYNCNTTSYVYDLVREQGLWSPLLG